VHACVRVRVRVCLAVPSGSVFAHACVRWCACVRGCVERLCACASALCWRCGGTAGTGGLNSLGAGGRACAVAFGAIGRVMCASAAGRTFTTRALTAEWAARAAHTSVVDAAGAIYVIGGADGGTGTAYQDLWASTDGGARAGLGRGGGRRVGHGGSTGYY
jgi:hypothetical protein